MVFKLNNYGKIPQLISREYGKFRVTIIVDRCKECGLCIAICPVKVLVKSSAENKYG